MTELQIFYDSQCIVCDKEISLYRKRNQDQKLEFVDIAHPDFDAENFSVDREAVQKEFHVKTKEGRLIVGVEAFIEIWTYIPGWSWAAKLARFPLFLWILKAGYVLFVWIRPVLPRRKDPCSSGVCSR
ncbi:DUF393 domain-containing protein [Oligoflexaceae bacterium]|nr:DUF393 domain-containing protein [Oligoflexaceae bacterium]